MRVVLVILAAALLSACTLPPPIASIDGPTCRRALNNHFWIPCDPDRLTRT